MESTTDASYLYERESPENQAAVLLQKSGQSAPPIDLDKLMELWSRLKLAYDDLDGEGFLVSLGRESAEILVRRQSPRERQRFTIAHEIGHWLLATDSGSSDGKLDQPEGAHSGDVERWCDRFAAELLMPSTWIRKELARDPLTIPPEELALLAARYVVSLSAFLTQVAKAFRVDIAKASFSLNDPDDMKTQFFLSRSSRSLAEVILQRARESLARQQRRSQEYRWSLGERLCRVVLWKTFLKKNEREVFAMWTI